MGDRRGQRRLSVAILAMVTSVLVAVPAGAHSPVPGDNPALAHGCPLDVALLVDASSSMRLDRDDIQDAMRELVTGLEGSGSRLSLVFGTSMATVVVPMTEVTPSATSATFEPAIGSYYAVYPSNWQAMLNKAPTADVVVLLSGATPLTAGTSRSDYVRNSAIALERAIDEANLLKSSGTRVIGVGYGSSPVDLVSGPLGYPAEPIQSADHAVVPVADIAGLMSELSSALCSAGGGVGDFVWWDVDADGRQDPGEPGIAGVTVQVTTPGGDLVDTDTTDGNGRYAMAGLAPGDYVVAVAESEFFTGGNLDGFTAAPPGVGDSGGDSDGVPGGVLVGVGDEPIDTIDFGFTYPTDVALDLELTASPAATVVAGDPVSLEVSIDNVGGAPATRVSLEALYDNFSLSSSSPAAADMNDDGSLWWPDLGPLSGSTSVSIDMTAVSPLLPAGVTLTATAFVDPDDGGPLPEVEVSTASVGTSLTVDAPPDALVGDRVWWDLDGNGLQDGGEPGLADVAVELVSGGLVIDSTSTDGSGAFAFDRLDAGSYTVRIAASEFDTGQTLDGFTASPVGAGDSDLDSNGHPTTHDADVVLAVDEHDRSIDFGFVLDAGPDGLLVNATLPGVQRFTGFYLPWEEGDLYHVLQGNGGTFSHRDEVNWYAWDFSLPAGTPVLAAAPGVVRFVFDGWEPGSPVSYGNYVLVQHGDRVCTVYVHIDTAIVARGDIVTQGQPIATAGSTGTNGSTHLHYAVDNCAWQSMPSSFVEAGVPLSGRMVESANPASNPPPLMVNPVEVGQLVAANIDTDYAGGATISRMTLRVTYDGDVLDYVAASANPNGGGSGFLLWNDVPVGDPFNVSFVTTGPRSGATLTATVELFTDPDGAGPLPEVSVTSGADGVSWEIAAPPEPAHLVGTIYHDLDGDGSRDLVEPPLEGVTVEAWFDDGDGEFEPLVDDFVYTFVSTDEFGQYDLEVPPDLPFWIVPAGSTIDGAVATNGAATLDSGAALTLGFAWPSVRVTAVPEDRPDGAPLIVPGPYPVSVTFNYTVLNTGETALKNLLLTDDVGTPTDLGDDVVVCVIDGPLAPGSQAACSLTRSVTGPGISTAVVTGVPTGWAPDAAGPAVVDTDTAEIQRLADGSNPDLRGDACGSDIVLVLDESGSASRWRTTFTQAARNFLAGVADTGTRVAVVEFSTTASLVVPYTEVTSGGLGTIETTFATYLDTGYYPTGFTNWKGALEIVRDELTSPAAVFFVTDGNPNILDGAWVTESSAAEGASGVADNLKAQGVHMFAVGVGRGHDVEYLEEISGPDRYPGVDFDGADYASSIRVDLVDEMLADYGTQLCTP